MGAVLYCRVSSEGQIERNVANLPTQEKKCREHCKRSKLTVLKVFVDAGESARTADRPQLHALLDYCRDHKGKVSHVIVADLSRGLESHFVQLLAMMQPTAELLAKLPDIAASNWEQRKERIAADRKQLSTRLNDETLLNRKAIAAKLKGELSEEDFQAVKAHIAETTASIHEQLKALESERCTLEDLMADAQHDIVNLAKAWLNAGINERQELQNTLFPEGLRFSPVCIHCRIQPMAEPPFGLVGWSAEADTPLRRKSWRVAIGASTLPPSE